MHKSAKALTLMFPLTLCGVLSHSFGSGQSIPSAAAPPWLRPRLVQGVIQRQPVWHNANNVLPFLDASKPAPQACPSIVNAKALGTPGCAPPLWGGLAPSRPCIRRCPALLSVVTRHYVCGCNALSWCASTVQGGKNVVPSNDHTACAASSWSYLCCRAFSSAGFFTTIGASQALPSIWMMTLALWPARGMLGIVMFSTAPQHILDRRD